MKVYRRVCKHEESDRVWRQFVAMMAGPPVHSEHCYQEITADDVPILHLDEDGDFHISWRDDPGEKGLVWSRWAEGIISGQFYIVPVPGTLDIDTEALGFYGGS